MKNLPEEVNPYSRTATFNFDSVPKALTKDHNTKPGVWGVINVDKGILKYVITEDGEEETISLNTGEKGVIAPQQKHYVSLNRDTEFYVEFYR